MLTRARTQYRYRDALDITSDKVSYVWYKGKVSVETPRLCPLR